MNLKNFSATRLISGGFCNFAKHGWICKLPVSILLRIQFQLGSILCKKSNFTLLSWHFQQNLFLEPSMIHKLVKRSSVSILAYNAHNVYSSSFVLFKYELASWGHEQPQTCSKPSCKIHPDNHLQDWSIGTKDKQASEVELWSKRSLHLRTKNCSQCTGSQGRPREVPGPCLGVHKRPLRRWPGGFGEALMGCRCRHCSDGGYSSFLTRLRGPFWQWWGVVMLRLGAGPGARLGAGPLSSKGSQLPDLKFEKMRAC